MKKILVLFVLLFSSSVFAEWTEIITNLSGSVIYLDKRSVKIIGDTRYMYFMFDFAKPSSYGDLSSKTYREIDCSNMMSKELIIDYFRYPLGEGNPTEGSGQIKDPEWEYFSPDAVFGILNKYVCDM